MSNVALNRPLASKLSCTQKSCARQLWGKVRFCPFCGASQGGASAQEEAAVLESPPVAAAASADLPTRGDVSAAASESKSAEALAPAAVGQEKSNLAREHAPLAAPEPVSHTAPAPAKRKWGRYVIAGVAALIGLKLLSPSPPDQCQLALSAAADAERSSALPVARGKALEAVGSCKGDLQAKARTLFESLDNKVQAAARCESAAANFATALSEGRLASAHVIASRDLSECMAPAELEAKKALIAEVQGKAESLQKTVEDKVAERDFDGARSTIAEISRIDRDFPQLASLNTLVEQAERQPMPAPEPAQTNAIPQQMQAPTLPALAAQPPVPAPTSTGAQDMVVSLLQDGEAALREKRYSDAKAIANSVLRMAPVPAARDLLRRAADAEARALRDETTLR